jgi:hypothetical protein
MVMKVVNPAPAPRKSETVGQAILRALAEMVADKFIEEQLTEAERFEDCRKRPDRPPRPPGRGRKHKGRMPPVARR